MASSQQQQDALSLDLSVLQALLQRNRTSHGRTLYFQRMSMALRAIQKHLSSFPLDSLQHALQDYSKSRQEWTLNNDSLNNIQKLFQQRQYLLERGVPELFSRIEYAAEALWTEVARGFFLPLCVVALGCLARIRILLIQKARQMTVDLQSLQSHYKDVDELKAIMLKQDFLEATHEHFVVPPLNQQEGTTSAKFDVERTLQSLGMSRGKRRQSEARSDTGGDMAVTNQVDEVDNAEFEASTTEQAVSSAMVRHDAHDDIGESVIGNASLLEMSEAAASKPESPHASLARNDDSDKNLQLLEQLKTTSEDRSDSKRKRNDESSETKKKKKIKKRKKEAKKKRKKDVMDEIFGD